MSLLQGIILSAKGNRRCCPEVTQTSMGCCHAGGGGVAVSLGQVSPIFISTFPSAGQLLD